MREYKKREIIRYIASDGTKIKPSAVEKVKEAMVKAKSQRLADVCMVFFDEAEENFKKQRGCTSVDRCGYYQRLAEIGIETTNDVKRIIAVINSGAEPIAV